MAEIRFYHCERQSLEQVLPLLLGKALQNGHRIVVKTHSKEAAEQLNQLLWTSKPESFLPHGSAKDGQGENHPVWLCANDDNPNEADVLILTQGQESTALADYKLVCDMIDGRDEQAVAQARKRWSAYKDAGHEVTYWQQSVQGGWDKKA